MRRSETRCDGRGAQPGSLCYGVIRDAVGPEPSNVSVNGGQLHARSRAHSRRWVGLIGTAHRTSQHRCAGMGTLMRGTLHHPELNA